MFNFFMNTDHKFFDKFRQCPRFCIISQYFYLLPSSKRVFHVEPSSSIYACVAGLTSSRAHGAQDFRGTVISSFSCNPFAVTSLSLPNEIQWSIRARYLIKGWNIWNIHMCTTTCFCEAFNISNHMSLVNIIQVHNFNAELDNQRSTISTIVLISVFLTWSKFGQRPTLSFKRFLLSNGNSITFALKGI